MTRFEFRLFVALLGLTYCVLAVATVKLLAPFPAYALAATAILGVCLLAILGVLVLLRYRWPPAA